MINLRRFPGFLYRYRTRFGGGILLGLTVVYLMHRWGFVCTNHTVNREIGKLCKLYEHGKVVGSLCQSLCQDRDVHSISCVTQHSSGRLVFTAKWKHRFVVIKSAASVKRMLIPSGGAKNLSTSWSLDGEERKEVMNEGNPDREKDVDAAIRNLVVERLNMSLTSDQLTSLRYLNLKDKLMYSDSPQRRTAEIRSIFKLLQSQEYLLGRLFADREVFPQILGTCGHLYGVEYLESPNFSSVFTLDDKAEWSERMKLAIAIMDFVEIVETDFPDALYFCDVQMTHLGVTRYGRIKFVDPELVFTKTVLDGKLKSGKKCKDHRDCDLHDCRSNCNVNEMICDGGVVNDNLQAVCEKIFIGWTMSGKVIVPGLLMSDYTPASLSALLRLCAENRRQAVPEDLRQRLYTILTEMHQILVQRLLS